MAQLLGKRIVCIAFIFSSVFVLAQGNVKQDLIVVHIDASSKTQFKQKLYAYHFLNGSFIGRDELLSFSGKKEGKDYIRTDRGDNVIYKNRYLITGIGNIIDLVDKKVLFDGKATLMRCSNDSAIFYTNDIFKGKFYSVFNFSTGSYSEVKDLLFKTKYGRDVEFDKSTKPYKILYFPAGKPRVTLIADAGYGQGKTSGELYVPDPPLFWIDNDNFMYAHYNESNTEVSFYKVNVESKKTSLVGRTVIANEIGMAEITKLNSEQVVFKLGNKQLFIDLESESITELDYTKPIYGFSYQCKYDPKFGHAVSLYGKEIGKFHFDSKHFVAGDNIAAFVKEMVIGLDRYQQGIMAWNATKQKWEAVDSDEVLTMIGWMKN